MYFPINILTFVPTGSLNFLSLAESMDESQRKKSNSVFLVTLFPHNRSRYYTQLYTGTSTLINITSIQNFNLKDYIFKHNKDFFLTIIQLSLLLPN